jgi:hypothetical protein
MAAMYHAIGFNSKDFAGLIDNHVSAGRANINLCVFLAWYDSNSASIIDARAVWPTSEIFLSAFSLQYLSE